MKIIHFVLSIFVLGLLFSCGENSMSTPRNQQYIVLDSTGTTIATRIPAPEGFTRLQLDVNSFGYFLRTLPVLAVGEKVHLFNGELKSNQAVHAAILDVSVGKRDLQQCADAVMRLRADFLYQQKKYADIHFHFVSGFDCRYDKWKEGYRVQLSGNKAVWVKSAGKDASYPTFLKYMETVYNYASTLSLDKELKAKSLDEVAIGDVLIKAGSPGHAVIVVDVVVNDQGEKLVLLAQSYMPAQQIHIVKNPANNELSPWINLKANSRIYTPEWTFEKNELKGF